MNYSTLDYSLRKQIALVILNRPDRLNAFTPTMADELEDVFSRVSTDDAIRACVVTGSGRAFCAGMDLGAEGNVFGLNEALHPTLEDMDVRFLDPEFIAGVRDTGGRVSLGIYKCTKPVIAAINGPAVGIGATMTLPMDIRLASEEGRFGFVFGKLGIVPEACSTWFLPRLVGIPTALRWFYTAEIIGVEEALRHNLISELVTADRLIDRAFEIAQSYVSDRSLSAISMTRQMVFRHVGAVHPIVAHKVELLAMFYTSIGDGKEGVAAFQEKRVADFSKGPLIPMPDFFFEWLERLDQ